VVRGSCLQGSSCSRRSIIRTHGMHRSVEAIEAIVAIYEVEEWYSLITTPLSSAQSPSLASGRSNKTWYQGIPMPIPSHSIVPFASLSPPELLPPSPTRRPRRPRYMALVVCRLRRPPPRPQVRHEMMMSNRLTMPLMIAMQTAPMPFTMAISTEPMVWQMERRQETTAPMLIDVDV